MGIAHATHENEAEDGEHRDAYPRQETMNSPLARYSGRREGNWRLPPTGQG